MRNKETGEFELVVGDKQLLSAFFIGVLLLAMVFAMGYVLGRGMPKSAGAASDTGSTPATGESRPPVPSVPAPVLPESTPPVMNPDVQHTDSTPPADAPPQPTTVPARDTTPPAPAPAPTRTVAPPVDPANGTYWQVLAGSQSSADALSQTLKGQGFPVITRPGPKELTLVWVGPYPDRESLGKARKQLEDAGITNLIKKP